MDKQTLVAVEEYLGTSYEPDVDYVDGVLEERDLGEFDHSDLQTEIALWLRNNYRPLGLNAFVELRTQVSATRYRVPDVLVIQGNRPKRGLVTTPPLAVIEVLSPEDRLSRVRTKMNDFLRFGVRHCWLIDPETRTASEYTLAGTHEVNDLVLRCSDPDFQIPLLALFANIDSVTG